MPRMFLLAFLIAAPAAADISVVTWGAACNGVADDTVAINKAVNQALEVGGAKVKFPRGRCIYSGAGILHDPGATVRAPLYLEGEGNLVTELIFTSCSNSWCIELNSQARSAGAHQRRDQ